MNENQGTKVGEGPQAANNPTRYVSQVRKLHPSFPQNRPHRRCRVCGQGIHAQEVDSTQANRASNFGLKPTDANAFKVYVCSHCGLSQLFFFKSGHSRAAWK
jgi:hypothetical protein